MQRARDLSDRNVQRRNSTELRRREPLYRRRLRRGARVHAHPRGQRQRVLGWQRVQWHGDVPERSLHGGLPACVRRLESVYVGQLRLGPRLPARGGRERNELHRRQCLQRARDLSGGHVQRRRGPELRRFEPLHSRCLRFGARMHSHPSRKRYRLHRRQRVQRRRDVPGRRVHAGRRARLRRLEYVHSGQLRLGSRLPARGRGQWNELFGRKPLQRRRDVSGGELRVGIAARLRRRQRVHRGQLQRGSRLPARQCTRQHALQRRQRLHAGRHLQRRDLPGGGRRFLR